jgi:hypothetical protein
MVNQQQGGLVPGLCMDGDMDGVKGSGALCSVITWHARLTCRLED